MSSATYVYERLDQSKRQIRLVHLLPGTWTDSISCELHVVSLDDIPQYEALSYVWGDPAITVPITVDSHEFQVTTNLCAALRRLRKERDIRVIWIDAICINQKLIQERNEQVSLMGEIYEGTKEAIIWLGDHVEATCSDPEMIEKGRELVSDITHGRLDPYTDLRLGENAIFAGFAAILLFPKLEYQKGSGILIYDENSTLQLHPRWPQGLNGLIQLTQFPWWGRIWTAQEAILPLSATMIYGSLEVPLDTFSEALEALGEEHIEYIIADKPDSIGNILLDLMLKVGSIHGMKYCRRSGDLDLARLLLTSNQRRATDVRDKVFALIGLFRNQPSLPSIEPDYSLTEQEVYRIATLKFLQLEPSMSLFELGLTKRAGMASWFLEWDIQLTATEAFSQLTLPHILHSQYSCHPCESSEVCFGEVEGGLLRVHTFHLDKMSCILQCAPLEAKVQPPLREQILEISRRAGYVDQTYITGGAWEDAYCHALTGVLHKDNDDKYVKWKAEWYETMTEKDLALRNDKDVQDLQAMVQINLSSRQVFVTVQGYLGVGPLGMQEDDEIHIFRGARMPYVVRKSTPTHKNIMGKESEVFQERYRLVGCCYVHGIMSGELFKNGEEVDFKPLILE